MEWLQLDMALDYAELHRLEQVLIQSCFSVGCRYRFHHYFKLLLETLDVLLRAATTSLVVLANTSELVD